MGRQLAMVMDLNKCLGCQTCTVACKTQWTNRNGREYMYWNNVESMPGKGYPRGYQEYDTGWSPDGRPRIGELPAIPEDYGVPWEVDYSAVREGSVLRPEPAPEWGPNWDEDVGDGDYPNGYYFYLPRICNHCTNPTCVAACPYQAIVKREKDGVVLVDLDKCRGMQMCIRSCPYKKVYFNASRARPDEGIQGQSEKCLFCFPRIEKGLPPACARQCVGRIRHVGYLDDEEGRVHKLVRKWKVALPLLPDRGTGPNVYYVPPLSPPKLDAEGKPTDEPRIPMAYLESLFGPDVGPALETLKTEMAKKARGETSELVDLLIAYRHEDMFEL